MYSCGLAGIGNLGKALTKQFDQKGIKVYAYHPNPQKREKFSKSFNYVEDVDFLSLMNKSIVLLAIPAEAIYSFIEKAQKEIDKNNLKPTLVNLSTLIDTQKLRSDFPGLDIEGVKLLGHANHLYQFGNGMFITETSFSDPKFYAVKSLFQKIGEVYNDDEKIVEVLNRTAVRKIIEACIEFENETKNYPDKYCEHSMKTIFPNTMELYKSGNYDGFMVKVMTEISEKI